MPAPAVAWVSQTLFFPALSSYFRPAAPGAALWAGKPEDQATQPRLQARKWARLGCLSVPVIAPLLPAPRTWPVPGLVTLPLKLARTSVAVLATQLSLRIAPPAACQGAAAGGSSWAGLQGDCRAQQHAWQQVWTQSLDGVVLGLLTGAAVVAGFAVAGAALGGAQSVGAQWFKGPEGLDEPDAQGTLGHQA